MRRPAGSVLLPISLALLSLPAAAQPRDLDAVKVRTEQVGGNVFVLAGAGGNTGVCVGPDGVFLVDDQYGPLAGRIREALSTLADRPVRVVLNTHWHADHVGGNAAFAKDAALVAAHENARARMAAPQRVAAMGTTVPALPPEGLPAMTFRDSVTFRLNGEEIEALHVPRAHTDGDVVVRFVLSDVLQTGDLFFNGAYPFVDTGSGGSFDGTIAAVDGLLATAGPCTRIIPGHGPVATREDLVRYRSMLADVRERVAALVRAGASVGGIVAARPTAPWDETWGKGFLSPDRFVAIVAKDLGAADEPPPPVTRPSSG